MSDTRVNLAWSASTDNIGVTGYRIFRDGTQIGTASGTTYADTTTQASTTYGYSIVAVDGAGNVSDASNTASATTPAPSSVLTFTPTADTYVQSDKATSNFGSATIISTDNSPIKHMLLKFAVSGVGTRSIASVKLRLYCIDPSSFGGNFQRVADTSWSESGVTWNTAPVADSASLGSIGKVVASTWYELDVTPLLSGDGTVSLRVSSTSTDGADYASKEGAAGVAPQLVVTVR
jgi:hypothetical protein